ncbi:MAG TPA: alanine racemase [Stellaceae bacterium]|nr:alanine racemase [Stellaceae bacterium]
MTEGIGHHAEIELDTECLCANYREIARRVGQGIKIIPAIKADAYGFGAVETATIFERLGAFALFTGNVAEAIAVRAAGVRIPVIMFGAYLPQDVRYLLAHGLIPTIYDREFAAAASAAATARSDVYIKVDAGLGRLGVPIAEAAEFIRWVSGLPNLSISGVYTHVPFADEDSAAWAKKCLAEFDALLGTLAAGGLSVPTSQARASSCVAAGLTDRANAVCVGHLLYGLSPFGESNSATLTGIKPVIRAIRSRLIHVGRHPQGSDLAIAGSYGLRRGRTTGVLPVGVSSGLGALDPAHPAHALIRGQRAPLLGVSLEHTTVDLEGVADPKVGDAVDLVAEAADGGLKLSEFAKAQGRSALATMVALSGHWRRNYVDPVKDVWSAFNRTP